MKYNLTLLSVLGLNLGLTLAQDAASLIAVGFPACAVSLFPSTNYKFPRSTSEHRSLVFKLATKQQQTNMAVVSLMEHANAPLGSRQLKPP
jgi:hypothetical protein